MPQTLGVAQIGGPAGGEPFNSLFDRVIPVKSAMDTLHIDAMLLWGGTDISASIYNERPSSTNEGPPLPSKRDQIELEIIRKCVANNIPIIGVCRGAQLLCAADGGRLAQDISGHLSGHEIVTQDGEIFFAAANHHQMMLPRPGNEIIATTRQQLHKGCFLGDNDKIEFLPEKHLEPEVVFFKDLNALGIQPHPEWMDKDTPFVKWVLDLVHYKFLG